MAVRADVLRVAAALVGLASENLVVVSRASDGVHDLVRLFAFVEVRAVGDEICKT